MNPNGKPVLDPPDYYVSPSDEDTVVPVEFGLLNGDDAASHVVLLNLATVEGWVLGPPLLPSSVTLDPGEFLTLETTVTVPANTPVGEQESLTLTATFQDNPTAQDISSNFVIVAPLGACCVPPDACVDVAEPECKTTGGYYHGDGSTCEVVFADGQCIPAVSEWGVAVMALLVLTAGTIVVKRRRAAPL